MGGRIEKQAWSDYWQKTRDVPKCLPWLPKIVEGHLNRIWQDFFLSLPSGAHVLDLGTGDGRVLKLALSVREDLHLVGIDQAELPSASNQNITLISGVRMESMPFNDHEFDGVTSFFAMEYGVLEDVLREILRVLSLSGRCLFLCHHFEGIIVKENAKRRAAIQSLLAPHGLLPAAIKAMRKGSRKARDSFRQLSHLYEKTYRMHPETSIVQEVGDDIAAIMASGDLQGLMELRLQLVMEAARISALEKAAFAKPRAMKVVEMFLKSGRNASLDEVFVPGVVAPFAWCISCLPSN